jgi:hypothetical protein
VDPAALDKKKKKKKTTNIKRSSDLNITKNCACIF